MEVESIIHLCAQCGDKFEKAASAKGQAASWCKPCRSQYMRNYMSERYRKETRFRSCKNCNEVFKRWQDYKHPGSAATHCQPCYLEKVRKRQTPTPKHAHPNPLAALRRQVMAEETHCGICGDLVDKTVRWPDRASPSLDHIVPTSLGGPELERSNVRLAHHGCNGDHYRRLVDARDAWLLDRIAIMAAAQWIGDRLAA
jgi:hypothetical protein